MESFLEFRERKKKGELGIINNNINNGNINNIQINNTIIKINAFGHESYEQILNDKDVSVKILKKLNYGVNSLFFTIYNEEQNRNFYKAYSGRRTIPRELQCLGGYTAHAEPVLSGDAARVR